MRQYEAISGPYLRWLRAASRRMGDRAWKLVEGLDGPEADAVMAAYGVVPYKESEHAALAKAAEADDPHLRRVLGSMLGIVEFVAVTYAEDAIVEVERPDDPGSVVDPRVLTDREAPSIDIDPMS